MCYWRVCVRKVATGIFPDWPLVRVRHITLNPLCTFMFLFSVKWLIRNDIHSTVCYSLCWSICWSICWGNGQRKSIEHNYDCPISGLEIPIRLFVIILRLLHSRDLNDWTLKKELVSSANRFYHEGICNWLRIPSGNNGMRNKVFHAGWSKCFNISLFHECIVWMAIRCSKGHSAIWKKLSIFYVSFSVWECFSRVVYVDFLCEKRVWKYRLSIHIQNFATQKYLHPFTILSGFQWFNMIPLYLSPLRFIFSRFSIRTI